MENDAYKVIFYKIPPRYIRLLKVKILIINMNGGVFFDVGREEVLGSRILKPFYLLYRGIDFLSQRFPRTYTE